MGCIRLVQGGAVSVCAAENVACKPIFRPNMGGKKTQSIKHQTRASYLHKIFGCFSNNIFLIIIIVLLERALKIDKRMGVLECGYLHTYMYVFGKYSLR